MDLSFSFKFSVFDSSPFRLIKCESWFDLILPFSIFFLLQQLMTFENFSILRKIEKKIPKNKKKVLLRIKLWLKSNHPI